MIKNILIKSVYITLCIIFIIILLFIKDINVDHLKPNFAIGSIIYLTIISFINLLLLIIDFCYKKSIIISFVVYIVLEILFIYLSVGIFGVKLFLSDNYFISITSIIFGIINLIPIILYLIEIINYKRGN